MSGELRIPSHRTILRILRDVGGYLQSVHQHKRAVRFEELIVESFARLFHLPFYDLDGDDSGVPHRVTWLGSRASSSCSASGSADGIVRAYEFCFAIEATLKTGTTQWSQEFSQCLRHARDVAATTGMPAASVYAVLLIQQAHEDTYTAVRSRNRRGDLRVLPLEVEVLARALETAALAFTLRHLDIRDLMNDALECLDRSDDLCDFRVRAEEASKAWQRRVLEAEKPAVVAVKSYETMVKIGRDHIGVGEILTRLLRHPVLKHYFRIIGSEMRPEIIATSLQSESLGSVRGKLPSGEELFCPVPLSDYRSRCARRQASVEHAHV